MDEKRDEAMDHLHRQQTDADDIQDAGCEPVLEHAAHAVIGAAQQGNETWQRGHASFPQAIRAIIPHQGKSRVLLMTMKLCGNYFCKAGTI
jgi:hypothetical protein